MPPKLRKSVSNGSLIVHVDVNVANAAKEKKQKRINVLLINKKSAMNLVIYR